MKQLSPSDTFLLSYQEGERPHFALLIDLYLPIVGAKALALYLALRRLSRGIERNFEGLSRFTSLSIGEIDASFSPLEAIGLLSTYRAKKEDHFSYFLMLREPATPGSFFTSPILAGTLKRMSSDSYLAKMKERYVPGGEAPSGYVDVGESYPSYFRPDEDLESYLSSMKKDPRRRSAIKTGFDWNLFLKTLVGFDPRYGKMSWSDSSKKRIEGYATLYGYKEEAIAEMFDARYDFTAAPNKRMDWKGLFSDLENAIRTPGVVKPAPKEPSSGKRGLLTEEFFKKARALSPRDFLSSLQNGNRVAEPDLRLLEKITVEMGLNSEVANGLIQYVLDNYDNTLPSALVEKLAGSLVRENIASVEDAMDYLTRTTKGKTRKKGKGESAKAEPKTEEGEKETPSERPLTPEEEENKRLFEDFMRSTFD